MLSNGQSRDLRRVLHSGYISMSLSSEGMYLEARILRVHGPGPHGEDSKDQPWRELRWNRQNLTFQCPSFPPPLGSVLMLEEK